MQFSSCLPFSSYDVALPCATQNEMTGDEATFAVKAGCKFVAEGSNMGCEPSAIEVFEKSRISKGKDGCWVSELRNIETPKYTCS